MAKKPSLIFWGSIDPFVLRQSLKDAFIIRYDVMLISDATASSNPKLSESTLENVKGYYGLVMDLPGLSRYLPPSSPEQTRPKTLRTT